MSAIKFPQGRGQPVGGRSRPRDAQPGGQSPRLQASDACKVRLTLDTLCERERGVLESLYDNARYSTVEQKRQALARAEGQIRELLAKLPDGPLPAQLAILRLIGRQATAHQFYWTALNDLGEA